MSGFRGIRRRCTLHSRVSYKVSNTKREEGRAYEAFGNLSRITTKSSSHSTTLPSGFVSGLSRYTPKPFLGSQPLTAFLARERALAGGESSAVGAGLDFLETDMSSATKG